MWRSWLIFGSHTQNMGLQINYYISAKMVDFRLKSSRLSTEVKSIFDSSQVDLRFTPSRLSTEVKSTIDLHEVDFRLKSFKTFDWN